MISSCINSLNQLDLLSPVYDVPEGIGEQGLLVDSAALGGAEAAVWQYLLPPSLLMITCGEILIFSPTTCTDLSGYFSP